MADKPIVWDQKKDQTNRFKHKVSFMEAAEVFFDPIALTVDDDEHSWNERRFLTIGKRVPIKFLSWPIRKVKQRSRSLPEDRAVPSVEHMKKEIDFSKGIRGKHSQADLRVLGAVRTLWAVCIETKEKSLIPFKLYQIESFSNSTDIRVKNERGEAKYYPGTWFVPIQIPKKTQGILEKAV